MPVEVFEPLPRYVFIVGQTRKEVKRPGPNGRVERDRMRLLFALSPINAVWSGRIRKPLGPESVPDVAVPPSLRGLVAPRRPAIVKMMPVC